MRRSGLRRVGRRGGKRLPRRERRNPRAPPSDPRPGGVQENQSVQEAREPSYRRSGDTLVQMAYPELNAVNDDSEGQAPLPESLFKPSQDKSSHEFFVEPAADNFSRE